MFKRFKLPKEEYLVNILIIIFFIIFIILAFFSDGSYGGADDITHYRFSRYAFKYPEFLLHHWAKPFYTLLIAPFSQIGFFGVRLFNVILGILSTFFTYKTAKLLNLENAFMVIFFLLLSTLYPVMMLSGMTEILFSFILIFAIFLFLKEKYIISAIILSFIPLVRTEGILILVIFILPYILNKKLKYASFLLTGIIIYSIVGGVYYNDFLWLITQMPYGNSTDIYGTGNLFHFVLQSKGIFGLVLTIIIFIGIISLIYYFAKHRKNENLNKINELIVLIFIPATIYYWAHSFSWYIGIGSSLGLIRVIAAVIPLFAIIALIGFNFIVNLLKKKSGFVLIFKVLVISLLFHSVLSLNKFPIPLGEKNLLIKKASNWLNKSQYRNAKVYYYDPYFFFFLEKDPYNKNIMEEFIPDRENPGNKMKVDEILIWDAHFSPNEGRLAFSKVNNSPLLKEIKVFEPKNKFTVLGGYEYKIVIYSRKANSTSKSIN